MIIEHDKYHKAEPCCNAILKEWLEVDTSAGWKKLFDIIESPLVSCNVVPGKGDQVLFCVSA